MSTIPSFIICSVLFGVGCWEADTAFKNHSNLNDLNMSVYTMITIKSILNILHILVHFYISYILDPSPTKPRGVVFLSLSFSVGIWNLVYYFNYFDLINNEFQKVIIAEMIIFFAHLLLIIIILFYVCYSLYCDYCIYIRNRNNAIITTTINETNQNENVDQL
jgi:hypothetical protein